jgi:cell division septum initiation protein DivIVA
MRISLALTGLTFLLLAGCSQAPDDRERTTTTDSDPAAPALERSADMNASTSAPTTADTRGNPDPLSPLPEPGSPESPPDVSPDAAPDVAFGYRYRFGLAADRVSQVQQRHARLCDELGAERCRVTGMTYRSRNEKDVRAELHLAVEPGLAHRFGERALDSVREAEGKLVDSEVTGKDVGSGIRTSTRTIAQLEEELAELEARIARGGSVGTLRDLRAEAESLRARIRALREDRGDKREQLATTPISFTYESGAFVGGTPDFGGVMATAWEQVKWLGYGVFALFMLLLPWLVGGYLVWALLKALGRRRRAIEADASAGPAS